MAISERSCFCNPSITPSVSGWAGIPASAKAVKCDEHIVKYLGVTLLPQAGVALGMAIKAATLGTDGAMVANITLFAVLVYELVGPLLTKIALTRAGDIKGKTTEGFNREKFLAEQAEKEAAEKTVAEQASTEQVAEPAGKN